MPFLVVPLLVMDHDKTPQFAYSHNSVGKMTRPPHMNKSNGGKAPMDARKMAGYDLVFTVSPKPNDNCRRSRTHCYYATGYAEYGKPKHRKRAIYAKCFDFIWFIPNTSKQQLTDRESNAKCSPNGRSSDWTIQQTHS